MYTHKRTHKEKKYTRHFLQTNTLKQNVTSFFLPSPSDASRVMGFWLFAYLLVQITFKMGALNHNGFSLPCYTVLTIHVLLMSISSIHFCISCMTGKHTNKSFLLHSSQVLTSLVWGKMKRHGAEGDVAVPLYLTWRKFSWLEITGNCLTTAKQQTEFLNC